MLQHLPPDPWRGETLGARNNGNVSSVHKCICANNHSPPTLIFFSLFALTTPARSVGPTFWNISRISLYIPTIHPGPAAISWHLDSCNGLLTCFPMSFPTIASNPFNWTRGISQRQKADQVTVLLHTLWRPYHDPLTWMIWLLRMVSKLISTSSFPPHQIPRSPHSASNMISLFFLRAGPSMLTFCLFQLCSLIFPISSFWSFRSQLLQRPSWPLVYKKSSDSYILPHDFLRASWLYNFILFNSLYLLLISLTLYNTLASGPWTVPKHR